MAGPQAASEFAQFTAWLLVGNLVLAGLLFALLGRRKRSRRRRDMPGDAFDGISEGLYRSSLEGTVIKANRSLAEMNGYASADQLIAAVRDIGAEFYVRPDRRREFQKLLERDGRVTDFVSEIYRHRTRERIWVTENARLVRDRISGVPLYYEGSIRDITRLMRHSQLEERLEKLADNLPGGLFQMVMRPGGGLHFPYASTGFAKLLGLTRPIAEIDPQDYLSGIHADDLAGYLAALEQSARNLSFWSCEFRYRRDRATTIWMLVSATPEKMPDGSIVWHGFVSDVSARKHAEERVHRLAYYDPLTELPNRRLFMQRLEAAIAANQRRGEHGAVLFIDIDNFKTLNDTQGHEMGDLLLRQVALRLRDCVRVSDTVSRFGGDEFVLLLDALDGVKAAAIANASGAANKILREFNRGFNLAGVSHSATPSIGVVVFDGASHTTAEIIKCADIAMYEAKKSGRNNYAVFDPASLKSVSEIYSLQRELAVAVRRAELFFEFQPQIDAEGRIFGAEALIRWKHPARGVLAPGEFVPIAEMTGLIMDINGWVLDEAVAILARWRDVPQMRDLNLAVNISVQQFRSSEFVERLRQRIRSAGIEASRLTLELTEHVMARDPENVARSMAELKATGLRFSLDDFGTGYSSLSQLNQFPFDEVKIDGLFVSDIEHRARNRTLIEAILGMAHALGLETVAEHVGSPFQVEFLKARGCTRFQGFYYYPPISGDALTELVTSRDQPRPLRLVQG